MRPRHSVGDGGGARAGEQAPGIVAAEQRRRQVQHVAVDEPRGVEVVGDAGAALDQQLDDALGPQLVEHSPSGPERSSAGCTLACAGARPSTTRRGWSAGSSPRAGGR